MCFSGLVASGGAKKRTAFSIFSVHMCSIRNSRTGLEYAFIKANNDAAIFSLNSGENLVFKTGKSWVLNVQQTKARSTGLRISSPEFLFIIHKSFNLKKLTHWKVYDKHSRATPMSSTCYYASVCVMCSNLRLYASTYVNTLRSALICFDLCKCALVGVELAWFV